MLFLVCIWHATIFDCSRGGRRYYIPCIRLSMTLTVFLGKY